jgi:hypothetical protein
LIIRNANYSLLADTEIVGFKRIVGSFIEASSFGAATLTYFAYTSRLWILGYKPRLTGILSGLGVVALIFSTSTTAYVGLALFLAFCFLDAAVRSLLFRVTEQMKLVLIWVPIVLAVVGLAIALNDSAATFVGNMADTLILNKMSTQSGYERSAWNAQALQTFFDTYGFGAGNGSLRASTFPLAVLGSLGIVGAVLFGLFLIGVFVNSRQSARLGVIELVNRDAARAACLATLISATVSGALTDLGLSFFAFAAMACSQPEKVSLRNAKGRTGGAEQEWQTSSDRRRPELTASPRPRQV